MIACTNFLHGSGAMASAAGEELNLFSETPRAAFAQVMDDQYAYQGLVQGHIPCLILAKKLENLDQSVALWFYLFL